MVTQLHWNLRAVYLPLSYAWVKVEKLWTAKKSIPRIHVTILQVVTVSVTVACHVVNTKT